jgi:hypothetical protein
MAKIGALPIGTIIPLNVNGTARDFIIVHQGKPSSAYHSSCDGTWLLMKDLYESRKAHSSENNAYATSDIHAYLKSTFLGYFDSSVKSSLKLARPPFTKGTGTSKNVVASDSSLETKVFLLSLIEVGETKNNVSVEGATLDYFNGATDSKRIAYLNGTATQWWLRSPATTNDFAFICVFASGSSGNLIQKSTYTRGVRPAIIIDSSFNVDVPLNFNGKVNVGGAWKDMSAMKVNVGGVWKDVSKIYTNVGGVWKE